MPLRSWTASAVWMTSNLPAWHQFRRALKEPQRAQRRKLLRLLRRNANTLFGKAHRFDQIHSYEQFATQVPLSNYPALEPWIAQIRKGQQRVLSADPVTHLIPTSGSTGARKLIPFTTSLQSEFNAAIGAWLVDTAREIPRLMGGPAYWSITPSLSEPTHEPSAVPIGFDTDTSYLAGFRRKLADALMAVPNTVARTQSLEEFRYHTLLYLLLNRGLRLISVWHPSFLILLLDALPLFWKRLLWDVERGTTITPPRPRRADELREAGPEALETLWPDLCIISCWAEGAAAPAARKLIQRFPNVRLQPKGLLSTEAFVTLPFRGKHPVAVGSHFFEFLDDAGKAHPVEDLRQDVEYEVVVTTGGGLWRYRLGDRVQVTGWVENTPSLRFLGRGESVSDQCGEKLSETFVVEALDELFGAAPPRFALLAPDEDVDGWRYTLYVEGEVEPQWSESLDRSLRRNPHYAYCRGLGQLLPLRLFAIAERGYEAFLKHQTARGARIGEVKPIALSRHTGWSEVFAGSYYARQSPLMAAH